MAGELQQIDKFYPKRVAAEVAKLMFDHSREMLVIETARRIVSGVSTIQRGPQYKISTEVAKIKAINEWVRYHVAFVRDPIGYEVIETPRRILERVRDNGRHAGDCDDISSLTGALMRAVGIPSRAHLVAFQKGRFQHIFADGHVPATQIGWVAVDPCLSDIEAPHMVRRIVDSHIVYPE